MALTKVSKGLSAITPILTTDIANLAITTGLLADKAIATGKIADKAVTGDQLSDTLNFSSKTVTLPPACVTTTALATNLDLSQKSVSLAANAIPALAITSDKMASASVITTALADNSVTYAKLGATEQKQVAKAWGSFLGGTAANLSATYSQSGTTVTVTTSSNHGMVAGNFVNTTKGTGTAVDGNYQVLATGLTNTSFQYTAGTSLTTSGTMTLNRSTIRGSAYNINSITKVGNGLYNVNLTTPMADTNYCVILSVGSNTNSSATNVQASLFTTGTAGQTVNCFSILCENASGADVDTVISIVVFGN
jgi:hypothetical protein